MLGNDYIMPNKTWGKEIYILQRSELNEVRKYSIAIVQCSTRKQWVDYTHLKMKVFGFKNVISLIGFLCFITEKNHQ